MQSMFSYNISFEHMKIVKYNFYHSIEECEMHNIYDTMQKMHFSRENYRVYFSKRLVYIKYYCVLTNVVVIQIIFSTGWEFEQEQIV